MVLHRDKILGAVEKGYLANQESTRVLILSGSHGGGDSGHSGLTDIGKLKGRGNAYMTSAL